MSFYVNMAATALKLLTKFGAKVTLQRGSGEVFDPITGTVLSGSVTSIVTVGLLRPYPDKVIDGKRIMSGDRELILSNAQTPQADDRVLIAGEDWSIQNIKTVQPDLATDVVFFVQVRK